jgi:hypothetical protein
MQGGNFENAHQFYSQYTCRGRGLEIYKQEGCNSLQKNTSKLREHSNSNTPLLLHHVTNFTIFATDVNSNNTITTKEIYTHHKTDYFKFKTWQSLTLNTTFTHKQDKMGLT